MKTIGMIGGTSYVSTLDYYKLINEKVNKRLGGQNAARILLYSLNIEEAVQHVDDHGWESFAEILSGIAKHLEEGGSECLMLCANTLHITAPVLKERINVPLIHIAEETADVISKDKLKKVGLLGTKFTMQADFYKEILSKHGIECFVPEEDDIAYIHDKIYTELTIGLVLDETKSRFLEIINKMKSKGAEGIILGCTELPLIIKPEDTDLLLYDTLVIHIEAAVNFALGDEV